MSVVVEVNNDPALTVVANNPSPGNVSSSNVTIDAPSGNDTIVISLWDQPQRTGTAPAGNELGQVTLHQTITAGKANTVTATIDGIAASVDLVPMPNQPTVVPTTDPANETVYVLNGDAAVAFQAIAKDADGNIILPPGTPIKYSASAVSPSLSVTPGAAYDQFLVRPVAPARTSVTLGVTVRAYDGTSNIAQSNARFSLLPFTYVAYRNGGGTATIAAFDSKGARVALNGNFPGLGTPVNITYDPVDHRIYELDGSTGSLLAFNSDGTPVAGFSPIAAPSATVANYFLASRRLYVGNSGDTISVFDPSGSPISVPGPFSHLSQPAEIADMAGPSNVHVLFIANSADHSLTCSDVDGVDCHPNPQYESNRTVIPINVLTGLTTDTLSIYACGQDASGDVLERVSPIMRITGSTRTGLSGPAQVSYNPVNGTLYLANGTSGTVTQYDGDLNLLSTIAAPSGMSQPISIAFVY